MRTLSRPLTASLLGLLILGSSVASATTASAQTSDPDETIGRTPPRLSYVEGEASFWRPGAADWAPAQLNTALAPGDEMFTGNRGNLELEVGARAFVRAWGDTQLGLVAQEPNFLQLKVTAGHVALDLRAIEPGRTVEIDTPTAAFTIDSPGYYRIDVSAERTAFSARSGRATLATAGGAPAAIANGEQVVLDASGAIHRSGAPALDVWDTWNYARTDELLKSASAQYVPAGVYGVRELDQYGAWRVVPTYGSVWVPHRVAPGWAPYSTGHWVADPYYGWTWVDDAPWGWAPYHYGRWVYTGGFWAWAPGPIVARPVYAPALVAFFGAPGIRVTVGSPFVSWVALGWGEPLVPWWGAPRFVGRPWWGGWGGPRVVNNVVINRTTVVHVRNINVYRNVNVGNAVVAVREDAFGRRGVREARVADVDVRRLEPVRGRLNVKPDASSFVAARGPAVKPPAQVLERHVVTTRRSIGPRAEPSRLEPRAETPRAEPNVQRPSAGRRPESPAERPRPEPRGESTRPESRVLSPRPEPNVERPRLEPRAESPRRESPDIPRLERRDRAPRPESGAGRGPEPAAAPRLDSPATPRSQPSVDSPRPASRAPGADTRVVAPSPEPRVEAPRAQARADGPRGPEPRREVREPQASPSHGVARDPAAGISPSRRDAGTPRWSAGGDSRGRGPAAVVERPDARRGPAAVVEREDARRAPRPAAAHDERDDPRGRR